MDSKALFILIPVLVIPWVFLLFVMLSSNKKVINNYRKLSEKYGLTPDLSKKIGMKNHPKAFGTYRNRNVKVESIISDSAEGKKVIPHTMLTVECLNDTNFSFLAVKRKRQNNIKYNAGSTLVDDNEFDGKYIIRTNDPAKLKRIFDFNTRFKLDRVHALGFDGIVTLEGNLLVYTEKDLLKNDEDLMRLELVMHEFCDIADVLKYN